MQEKGILISHNCGDDNFDENLIHLILIMQNFE